MGVPKADALTDARAGNFAAGLLLTSHVKHVPKHFGQAGLIAKKKTA
ncbi:MAG: hypothetical protein AB1813_09900 [Verrucomicrobiota bacterium]